MVAPRDCSSSTEKNPKSQSPLVIWRLFIPVATVLGWLVQTPDYHDLAHCGSRVSSSTLAVPSLKMGFQGGNIHSKMWRQEIETIVEQIKYQYARP